MLSTILYSSPAHRAKSPLGRKNSTRAYPASSPRRIPIGFVSLGRSCKPTSRKPVTVRTFQRENPSIQSTAKALVSLDDYGGHLALSPPRSDATLANPTDTPPTSLDGSPRAMTPVRKRSSSSSSPLAMDMNLWSEESIDVPSYPRPLAQRPFWMPPSSPGGLKPRYPPSSSQVKHDRPSPLRKLRRSVIRVAKVADGSLAPRCVPRRASLDNLEDSELPYAKLRESIPAPSEARLSEGTSRSSSIFHWQRAMPSPSSTVSDAGYAAQASRGRPRRISGRIQLTDQDIIEADAATLVDSLDEGNDDEHSNVTTLQLRTRTPATILPNQLRSWRPTSPSPLLDTSRTDIGPDRPADAIEDDREGSRIDGHYSGPDYQGENREKGSGDDEDVAHAIESAGRGQLRSSHTFGPGTKSAFAEAHAPSLSAESESFDTSFEVVELSCFALTTPSDDHGQPVVHLDQIGIETDDTRPAVNCSEQQVEPMVDACQISSMAQSAALSSLLPARVESSYDFVHLPSHDTCTPGMVLTSLERTSRKLHAMPSSRSYGALMSPPEPSATLRSSFVPRPFLLSRPAIGTSGWTSPASPSAPRPLLLADQDVRFPESGATSDSLTTSSSLGLSLLQLARSSISSSSTSRSKGSSGLLSPQLSLEGYLRYSPSQSPDWTSTCVPSQLSDGRHQSRKLRRGSSYVVLPSSLSTLTARSARRASKAHTDSFDEANTNRCHILSDAVQETFAILDGRRDAQVVSPTATNHIGAALHQLTGSAL